MKTKIVTAVLSVLTMAGLTFVWGNASFAAGQTCVWTGTAGDGLFSTAANWSNCLGAAPTAGDVLEFDRDAITSSTNVLTNDLPSVAFAGVTTKTTTPSINTDVWGVSISSLRLAPGGYVYAGINDAASDRMRVSISNSDGSSGQLTAEGSAELRGDVDARGYNITGTLTLTPLNYYYASAFVDEADTFGGIVLNGSADGTTGQSTLTFNYADDGTANYNFPVTVASSNATDTPFSIEGKCDAYSGMTCTAPVATTTTIAGPITLSKDAQVYIREATTASFTGTITGGTLSKNPLSPGTLQIGGTTVVAPEKTTEYSGDQNTKQETVAENETAIMKEGSVRDMVTVARGGTLKGVGTIDFLLNVYDGGTVAPGMSPGCLTANILALDGEYEFEIGGNDPCTGYDQIKVTDADESVYLGDTSVLTTSRYNNFTPKQNQVFTIIDNQGSQAVDGTFKDLPEGATFTQNGVVFKVSYVGGNGNDVTLTVMNQPTAPNTGFELVKANPVVTAVAALLATTALLVIGRRLQTQR